MNTKTMKCCECKLEFEVPESLRLTRTLDSACYYCPRCGTSQSYDIEANEREKRVLNLLEERDGLKRSNVFLGDSYRTRGLHIDHLKKSLGAARGVVTKLKKKLVAMKAGK